MGRSHKIWVEADGGSAKSFGIGQDDYITLKVRIGSSSSLSQKMSVIRIGYHENDGVREFEIIIDGQLYRKQSLDIVERQFGKLFGYKIDGDPDVQRRAQDKEGVANLKAIASVMMMGDILGQTLEEKNKWKERMLKAGTGDALHLPDKWNELDEKEKAKRLTKVSKILQS